MCIILGVLKIMLFIEALFGNSRKMETIQISMKGNLGGETTMNYTKEYYDGRVSECTAAVVINVEESHQHSEETSAGRLLYIYSACLHIV